jgi:hypothetical protein
MSSPVLAPAFKRFVSGDGFHESFVERDLTAGCFPSPVSFPRLRERKGKAFDRGAERRGSRGGNRSGQASDPTW